MMILPLSAAKADLTITPIRIVFEGRGRSATVELLNQTDRTNTYRLKWLEMKMGPGGRYQLVPADENNPYSVAKMVIFTPRQVTIAPHGYQTIRLALRRPADLPPGEYRAHLAMVRLARQGPERDTEKNIGIELKVNLGFSIPVIVRSGSDDLKVSLSSPKLEMRPSKNPKEAGRPVLNLSLNRDSGKFSSYGDITIYWRPAGGSEKKVGMLNNIALYPELQQRELSIPLNQLPTDGSIRVVYDGKLEAEGKTWAEKTFPIGK
jgi:hypothetical protein